MTKWTTLARLKDDMWEENREYFRDDNLYHLLRLMFRLKACVDFKLNRVTVAVGVHNLVFSAENIVVALKNAMLRVEEIEQHD